MIELHKIKLEAGAHIKEKTISNAFCVHGPIIVFRRSLPCKTFPPSTINRKRREKKLEFAQIFLDLFELVFFLRLFTFPIYLIIISSKRCILCAVFVCFFFISTFPDIRGLSKESNQSQLHARCWFLRMISCFCFNFVSFFCRRLMRQWQWKWCGFLKVI